MDSKEALSVDQVIQNLQLLRGRTIQVCGQFIYEREQHALNHIPDDERKSKKGFQSSLWIDTDPRYFKSISILDYDFNTRLVVVEGVLGDIGRAGHFGMWPASMLISRISLLSDES
ncbi:hypothetical protein [Lacunimicrobium album]